MWGLNMSNPCAQTYLDSMFQQLASWGVDYVKVDDNRQLTGGNRPVWTAEVPGTDDRYVSLFNLAEFGIGSATVTDLWSGTDLGTVSGTFARSLPGHGAGLYRLDPETTVPPPTAYTVVARHSGKCLEVRGAATTDGAEVTQSTCDTAPSKLWQRRPL